MLEKQIAMMKQGEAEYCIEDVKIMIKTPCFGGHIDTLKASLQRMERYLQQKRLEDIVSEYFKLKSNTMSKSRKVVQQQQNVVQQQRTDRSRTPN